MAHKTTKITLPSKIFQELQELENYNGWPRSYLIEQALRMGLKRLKLDLAVELYSKAKVTLGQAAKIAELSVWEMMDTLAERGVGSQLTKDDFEASKKYKAVGEDRKRRH